MKKLLNRAGLAAALLGFLSRVVPMAVTAGDYAGKSRGAGGPVGAIWAAANGVGKMGPGILLLGVLGMLLLSALFTAMWLEERG